MGKSKRECWECRITTEHRLCLTSDMEVHSQCGDKVGKPIRLLSDSRQGIFIKIVFMAERSNLSFPSIVVHRLEPSHMSFKYP